jgi:hypothetical protein
MNKVTLAKRRLQCEHWKSIIASCQSSGMTVKTWCEQNNICLQTYYRNLKKFREELCNSLPGLIDEPEKPVVFKQLEVAPPTSTNRASVLIHLPSATLEVADGTSQLTIEAVLRALKSVC